MLFLGIEKVATGIEAGIERLAWAMRVHKSMHQTTCIFISAARHIVEVKLCFRGKIRVCIANRSWWTSISLEMQEISSHFLGRP